MTTPISIPDSVIQVWKDGDSLRVACNGHQFLIKLQPWEWLGTPRPCSNSDHPLASCPSGGLRTLALLCKNREAFANPKIGHEASPTQWDIIAKTLPELAIAEERAMRALAKKAERLRMVKAKETEATRVKNLVKTDPAAFLREIGLL